jgi:probable HAF family extracellular repeat protein
MYRRPLLVPFAICWLVGLASGWPAANAQNLLTDLGPGTAYGINNNGQVVLSNGVWSNGTFTAFPTGFTGDAINANGQVVGNVINNGLDTTNAALFDQGNVTDLGVLPGANPTLDVSMAYGINGNGQVVGWSATRGAQSVYGFIYSNGAMASIGPFPGTLSNGVNSQANSINDAGQVTGAAAQDGVGVSSFTSYHAFIYDSGTWTDLGYGEGFAINAAGQTTGVFSFGPVQSIPMMIVGHAFLYSNGTMSDLGTLPGGSTATGYAINASGQVVGSSSIPLTLHTHAFFYNGAMYDLNALVSAADPLQPSVVLTEARGINDSRLIVANGIDLETAAQHAYLLQGPWLDVSPGIVAFPSQTVGTVSAAQSVSLTNSGPTALALGAISTSGDFSETNNCGASLAPAGACTALVSFAPTAADYRTGTLTIVSNGVPMAVPLAGGPIQVTISSSPANTFAGSPIQLTWTASPAQASCTATGGSAVDGWNGLIATSGTADVGEPNAGTYDYGLTCRVGSQSASAQVSVKALDVNVSISASPTTITPGQLITLTWKSSNADTCVATGGGAGDNWPGTKSTNGSAMVTESGTPATLPLTLTFTLECSANVGEATIANGAANTVVVEDAPPPPKPTGGGGGGSLNPFAVLFLAGLSALRRFRQSNLRGASHKTMISAACSAAEVGHCAGPVCPAIGLKSNPTLWIANTVQTWSLACKL